MSLPYMNLSHLSVLETVRIHDAIVELHDALFAVNENISRQMSDVLRLHLDDPELIAKGFVRLLHSDDAKTLESEC